MPVTKTQQDALEQTIWGLRTAPVKMASRLAPGRVRRQLVGASRIHLGCGSHLLQGWANLDVTGPAGVVRFDLGRPLPLADSSVDLVFSEHFLEHVTREGGIRVLRECARVLRPGGTLRLSTPDLRVLAEQYLAGQVDEWAADGWTPGTPCQLLNEGLRLWGHRFVWDEPELTAVLRELGFVDVTRVGWRESRHQDLRDLECRPFHGDLIVEATA